MFLLACRRHTERLEYPGKLVLAMNPIEIAYLEPLESAWGKMKNLLFRPFDLSRWMVIGFTAWLALLGKYAGCGGNFNFPRDYRHGSFQQLGTFLQQHLALVISIITGVLLIGAVVGLLLAWLSARGKFMFLDNALTGHAEIVEPWQCWRQQGNSLFLWLIAYGLIILGAALALCGLCLGLAWPDLQARVFSGRTVAAVVAGFFLLFPGLVVIGYIMVLLEDFVVPLMRKHNLKTNAAWHFFLPLLRIHFGPFLLYGLIRFAVDLLLGTGMVLAGCLTCCCLFCLAAIPYLGTALLLPIYVWRRYWGVEFLRQFGLEYDAWPAEPPPLKNALPE